MNAPKILLIFLSLFILTSCDDEPETEPTFRLGSSDAASIHSFNPPVLLDVEGNGDAYLDIDFNKDGASDLRLSGYKSTQSGFHLSYFSIDLLAENFEVASQPFPDTVFVCKDSLNHRETRYNKLFPFNCLGSKEIYFVENFEEVDQYHSGDLPPSNITWIDENIRLSFVDTSAYLGIDSVQVKNQFGWPSWLNKSMGYVLIREYKNGVTKYGWIKLELTGYNEATLYDYGFQN